MSEKFKFKCVMMKYVKLDAEIVYIVFRAIALPPAMN